MTRPLPPELYTVPVIGEVARWLNDVMEEVQTELAWLMTEIWNHLPDWIKTPIDVLKTFFENLPYELERFFSDPIGYAYSLFDWVWEHLPWSIRYPLEKLRDFFLSLWNEFTEFFRDPLAKLRELADRVWSIIPDWAKKPLETFAGFLGKIPYEFEKFLEDPAGYAWIFLNWIYERLPPHFKAVISAAYSFFQSLYDKVSDFFQDPVKALSGLVDNVTGAFNVAFDGAKEAISGAIERVFGDPLKAIEDFFGKGAKGFWDGLVTFFTRTLPSSISSIFSVLNPANLLDFMSKLAGIGSGVKGHFIDRVKRFIEKLKKFLKGELGDDPIEAYTNLLEAASETVVEVEFSTMAMEMAMGWKYTGLGGSLGGILLDSTVGSVIGTSSGTILDALLQPAKNWVRERIRGNFPSIPDAGQMLHRGKISMEQFETVLKWTGISDEWFEGYKEIIKPLPSFWEAVNMWRRGQLSEDEVKTVLKWRGYDDKFIAGYMALTEELPSERDVFDMFFRGVIEESDLDDYLKKKGYTDKWAKAFKEIMWYYPSVSDLIRFFVREAIPAVHGELARAKLVGIPKKFYEYGKKAGIPAEWVEAYWASHWILPSTEQVYEMLHRGLKSPYTGSTMTVDDVKTFLKEADIDPRWRENLVDLSYKLPGRIEARWGVEWGVWDWTRMQEFLKADGIHPDWIPDTIKAEKANVFREHIGAVKSILVSKYQDGFISEEELKNRLKKLGYPDEAVTYIIWSAQEKYDYDWKKEMAKAYIDAYEDGKISADELRSALSGLGMIPDRIEHIIEMTTLKKEKTPPPPETLEKRLRTLEEREASLIRQLEDKRTDLEDLKRLYEAEMAIYDERIEEQKMRIQAATTPEAKAREEQKLKILEARKEKAKIRYEARISDLEETIRMLEDRLDEVRTEISALKQALGTPTAS